MSKRESERPSVRRRVMNAAAAGFNVIRVGMNETKETQSVRSMPATGDGTERDACVRACLLAACMCVSVCVCVNIFLEWEKEISKTEPSEKKRRSFGLSVELGSSYCSSANIIWIRSHCCVQSLHRISSTKY